MFYFLLSSKQTYRTQFNNTYHLHKYSGIYDYMKLSRSGAEVANVQPSNEISSFYIVQHRENGPGWNSTSTSFDSLSVYESTIHSPNYYCSHTEYKVYCIMLIENRYNLYISKSFYILSSNIGKMVQDGTRPRPRPRPPLIH